MESENENLKENNTGKVCKEMHCLSANNSSDAQETSRSRYRKEDWTTLETYCSCTGCFMTPIVLVCTGAAVPFASLHTKPYEKFEVDTKLESDRLIRLHIGLTNMKAEPHHFTQMDQTWPRDQCTKEAMCEFRLCHSLTLYCGRLYQRLCLSNAQRIGIMYDVAKRIHFRIADETVYVSYPMMLDSLYMYTNPLSGYPVSKMKARIIRPSGEKRIYFHESL